MAASLVVSLLIMMAGLSILPTSSASWIGMFQLKRIQRVENAIASIKEDGESKVLPVELAQAEQDRTRLTIQKAHMFTMRNWWGEEYQRVLLSARLLGLSSDPAFQQALDQGWLSKKQSDKWAQFLRNNPPEILRASPLHQAAYLRMIGEVEIDKKFNIEKDDE